MGLAASSSRLVGALPAGPLDIIGDVHGELGALRQLLRHLGYDTAGHHPDQRRLVFVGDLCDRGHDSPGVLALVRRLVNEGRAQCLLGNHELNLLRGERRDGNDWFWSEGLARDQRYQPWRQLPAADRDAALAFLDGLPMALEREDLRVVHAAWHESSVQALRTLDAAAGGGSVRLHFDRLELLAQAALQQDDLPRRHAAEMAQWAHALHDPDTEPPLLEAVARVEQLRQMAHPIRVLSSGLEQPTARPFFAGGRWRFTARQRWWDDHPAGPPVLVGHYWRSRQGLDRILPGKHGDPALFDGIAADAWHGQGARVFCVDFSVGVRFKERQRGLTTGSLGCLAAMRWPERILVTDDGVRCPTTDGSWSGLSRPG